MLLFSPVPMPARVFVVMYAILGLYLGVTGPRNGVGAFCLMGGMIAGSRCCAIGAVSAAGVGWRAKQPLGRELPSA